MHLVAASFTFYIQVVVKFKKNNSGAKRLTYTVCFCKADNSVASVSGSNRHSIHLNSAPKQSTTFSQWKGLNLVDLKQIKFASTNVKPISQTVKCGKANWIVIITIIIILFTELGSHQVAVVILHVYKI